GFLRTRTFEVTSNTLWYRYRGEAEVFLAVDSHRVVAGPLHGVVRQHLADTKGKVRWIAHPVRDYIGHRVHVEFTPKSRDFALLEVRFSKDKPGDAFKVNRRVFDALVRLDGLASPATIETAARAVEATFRGALDDLATGALVRASADEARDAARLVNWLIARPELFAETPRTEELSNVLRERMARFLEAKAAIERQIPPPIRALTLLDGNGEDEPVHIRGNARTRGEMIARRYLSAIRYSDDLDLAPLTGSGRLELARRLTSLENPLTLRVWVNRVWHWLFGRGLVRSVDDFGRMGDPPTHPELLDWLALDFARNGWSTKRLIREIVLSSTYRQSSRPRPEAEAIDARNVLWHRMGVRRISAEAIRDSLLAFSGRLELR
ncbi:MAG TPA: DUF1553 domain-containing protein, partial [Planctomycetota bacterium]|nr:DUF1553 domain-containing protein [Planctomycetota bacterium]